MLRTKERKKDLILDDTKKNEVWKLVIAVFNSIFFLF